MAVLNTTELAEVRREFVKTLATINVTKVPLNAAIQAIENWFESNRSNLSQAIETAAPGAFSVAAKKALVKFWLFSKFGRE
jgi:hypothetical protein